MNRFIVAEISKSWPNQDKTIIAQQFEDVIAVNLGRGYVLHSFSHSSAIAPDCQGQSETIIAVFESARAAAQPPEVDK